MSAANGLGNLKRILTLFQQLLDQFKGIFLTRLLAGHFCSFLGYTLLLYSKLPMNTSQITF
jgi:hypothetical protein